MFTYFNLKFQLQTTNFQNESTMHRHQEKKYKKYFHFMENNLQQNKNKKKMIFTLNVDNIIQWEREK